MQQQTEPLLEIEGLRTGFRTRTGQAWAVDGIDLTVRRGTTLCLVGESGSGKTVTALSILRLVPSPPGRIAAGSIRFEGKDLLELPERQMRHIRGNRISTIFQEPMTSLNPVFTIGNQVAGAIRLHRKVPCREAGARAASMLSRVGLPGPGTTMQDYPNKLSGGMRQRAMIAMALSCRPNLLIADEPTTALDVSIQAQILNLMMDLQASYGLTYLLISHDLRVVEHMSDRVCVMYLGRIVEIAPSASLYASPCHPYTRALLAAVPVPDPHKKPSCKAVRGDVPSPLAPPPGCRFHPRCPHSMEACTGRAPHLREVRPGHHVACHLY